MSVASHAGAVLGTLAAVGAVVSLWRSAERHNGSLRHAYRWIAGAAALWGAGVVMAQALSASFGGESVPLSIADLPALLALPVMAMGMARLATPADRAGAPARVLWRDPARMMEWLADGYVVASALFLIGWISLFGAAFNRAGTGPGTFALEMVRPLGDLLLLGGTVPLVAVAGRRGVMPYLAVAVITLGDSLAVSAQVTGVVPGAGAMFAMIIGFLLLACAPRATVHQWEFARRLVRMWTPRGAQRGRRAGAPADAQHSRRTGAPADAQHGLAAGDPALARPAAAPPAPALPAEQAEAQDVPAGPSAAGGPAADASPDQPPGRAAAERDASDHRSGPGQPVAMTVAACAAGLAGMALITWGIAGESLARPVVPLVAGTMVLVLAARIVGLVSREYSARSSWRDSRRQFRQLADRTSDAVLLADLAGVIRYAGRAVAGYGYPPEGLRGSALADLLHPEDRAGGARAVRQAVADSGGRAGRYPCRVRAADGTWRHVEATVSRYREPGGGDLLLVTARDISDQVALRRQVTHLTFHDGLTGLPNRAYVDQRTRNSQADPVAGPADEPAPAAVAGVIFLDLDAFTAVNDEVGHSAGDLLLAQVAHRLRAAVPPQDTVARWGGDEFAILIEGAASAEEIVDIAQRLERSVSATAFRLGDRDVTLTASVGVALTEDGPTGYVWRNADVAMTRAKLLGGGRVEVFGSAGPGDGRGHGSVPESETKLLSG